MAFSSTIHDILIGHQTPVEPGGEVLGTVIDVHGSTEVNLALSAAAAQADLRWAVHFGPTQSGKLVEVASGTFAESSVAAIVVPTFGVRMLVTVHNDGPAPTWVEGMVYFVRKA